MNAKRAKAHKSSTTKLFVLDTNVLMHDPLSLFRFEEHDIYLPMVVLEELDANKKGLSEASRNVRQVSRFLDDLMRSATKEEIDRGLPLPAALGGNAGKKPSAGRLFFQTRQLSSALPDHLPGHGNDNAILAQTLALQALHQLGNVLVGHHPLFEHIVHDGALAHHIAHIGADGSSQRHYRNAALAHQVNYFAIGGVRQVHITHGGQEPLRALLQAVAVYAKRATGEKVLIDPSLS